MPNATRSKHGTCGETPRVVVRTRCGSLITGCEPMARLLSTNESGCACSPKGGEGRVRWHGGARCEESCAANACGGVTAWCDEPAGPAVSSLMNGYVPGGREAGKWDWSVESGEVVRGGVAFGEGPIVSAVVRGVGVHLVVGNWCVV